MPSWQMLKRWCMMRTCILKPGLWKVSVMTAMTSRSSIVKYCWWKGVAKSWSDWKLPSISARRLSPVSATLRSVCRIAHTIESMTSFICSEDMVKNTRKQRLLMARRRLKKRRRISGYCGKRSGARGLGVW